MPNVGVSRPVTRVGVRGPAVRPGVARPDVRQVVVAREVQRVAVKGPGFHNGVRITAGPPGPAGPSGLPAPGAYYAAVTFAVAALTWTITLPADVSSYATNVDTITPSGEPIRGEVSRPDASTIQIDWYYPTAGTARVYR